MPLAIALVAQKGGAGKTTIALNLADALRVDGRRVLIVDADPQATARIFADVAVERGVEAPPVIGATGPSMKQAVAAVAESFDAIIIDTPPRMSAEAKAAMALARIVLVPVSPGPADVWALGHTTAALDEVRAFRPDLIARVVLNRVDRRTALSQTLGEDAATSGLTVMSSALGNRVAYPEATAGGQGVVSYAPDSVAAGEVRALLDEVLQLAEGAS
jgi:chromosome partitioning protein